jgi:hypothetical protein
LGTTRRHHNSHGSAGKLLAPAIDLPRDDIHVPGHRDTDEPGANASATIDRFCSLLHRGAVRSRISLRCASSQYVPCADPSHVACTSARTGRSTTRPRGGPYRPYRTDTNPFQVHHSLSKIQSVPHVGVASRMWWKFPAQPPGRVKLSYQAARSTS